MHYFIMQRCQTQEPVVHIKAALLDTNELPPEYLQNANYKFSVLGNPEYSNSKKFCRIMVLDNGIGFLRSLPG
jgi:hypothetical protein